MNLSRALSETLLPRIEKPSRYLGTEHNTVHKDLAAVDVRLALCFPDLYDIGLGNLGLHILYAILNRLDGVWAERVYAPGLDLERELRERGLPMFALESRDSLDVFDGIGFTLQTELTYTNILNVLDLAGVPLRTRDRREADPLTFAGGPSVFNPEPLAPFMDFFVIGDGEQVVVEIAELLRLVKGRAARLRALAELDGVYVPALHPTETLADGTVLPTGPVVRKRTTPKLDGGSFPVDYVVPFTEQVHDRISMEVLRGCTQGCRFCQAGMTTRPVRERTVEDVGTLLQRTLDATGYEDVSLVSLSTCDHSRVRQLVEKAVAVARPQRASVSLPSLRLDSFSVELADMVASTRRTGLTFAPEAASPRLRAVINKWIPDEDLLQMAGQAFARGWDHVKLYFMIGLPTERDDDLLAIADLCRRVVAEGRKYNRNAMVHTGISTFVPKPFTPFQWVPQIDLAETERRQRVLFGAIRGERGIKFGRHHPEETFLEGLISRSDRRVADVIELAWRKGARFDAWSEHLRFDLWMKAVEETGFDVQHALRARDPEERLPWDHVDIHIPKKWFQEDWARAQVLEHAQDCRHSKCHKCGVIDVHRPLCASMLRNAIAGAKEEKTWVRGDATAPAADPDPVMRARLRVGRTGDARWLSHLEFMHGWLRALRRARAPLSWSRGFHPHPRVNFGAALPVGEESTGEYMDVVLTERIEPAALAAALAAVVPSGFLVLGGTEVPLHAPGLMNEVAGATWTLFPDAPRPEVEAAVARVLAAETLIVTREGKKGPAPLDLRPMFTDVRVRPDGAVELSAQEVGGKIPKGKELVALFGFDADRARVLRRDVMIRVDGRLVSAGDDAYPAGSR